MSPFLLGGAYCSTSTQSIYNEHRELIRVNRETCPCNRYFMSSHYPSSLHPNITIIHVWFDIWSSSYYSMDVIFIKLEVPITWFLQLIIIIIIIINVIIIIIPTFAIFIFLLMRIKFTSDDRKCPIYISSVATFIFTPAGLWSRRISHFAFIHP